MIGYAPFSWNLQKCSVYVFKFLTFFNLICYLRVSSLIITKCYGSCSLAIITNEVMSFANFKKFKIFLKFSFKFNDQSLKLWILKNLQNYHHFRRSSIYSIHTFVNDPLFVRYFFLDPKKQFFTENADTGITSIRKTNIISAPEFSSNFQT